MPEENAETFGYRCIRRIAEAKLKKNDTGQILMMSEVAQIIDEEDLRRMMVCTPDASAATPAEQVYETYPRHVGRKTALRAITAALKVLPLSQMLERVQAYKTATEQWPASERQFIPYPATWFNRGSYMDDPKEWERGRPPTTGHTDTTDYSRF